MLHQNIEVIQWGQYIGAHLSAYEGPDRIKGEPQSLWDEVIKHTVVVNEARLHAALANGWL